MKRFLITLTVAASLFSMSAISAEIPTLSQGDNAYRTLMNLFNNSKDSISETDIDLASNAQSNQKCSFVQEKEQKKIFSGNILRFEVVISGQPSNGPLFPGTPDTKTNMFMINRENTRNASLEKWENFAKSGVKAVTEKEIQTVITSSNLSDSPIQIRLRKNQDFITTEVILYKGSAQQVAVYGYCYRQ